MSCYAFIFARGGSKGVPGKNIKPINGIPLIAYSIRTAIRNNEITKVFVSTDDEEIANVAIKFDAEVIIRPESLAQDDSSEWLAWRHAVSYVTERYGRFHRFINLPATSPLRNDLDVERCLNLFDNNVDIVIAVSESGRNPFYNMVTIDESGLAHLVNRPSQKITVRQEAPPIYDITTVAYVTSPNFILSADGVLDGKVGAVVIPQERAIDIDTPIDFYIADCLLKKEIINEKNS